VTVKDPNHNIDTLKWRLAEAIVWCTTRGSISDAAIAARNLRTPELCPPGFVYSKDNYGYTRMDPSLGSLKAGAFRNVVEEVATLRVRQLKVNNIYPLAPAQDLAGGRLLCYAPYENLAEGVEEQETQGYFDVEALPPWDTWLWFLDQQTQLGRPRHKQWHWYSTYMICWAPPELVDIVDKGAVGTSTTDALEWADDLDSDLFSQLREAGIIT
jgi:hypothetical protein